MLMDKDFDREELIALAIYDLSREQIEPALAKLKRAIATDKHIDRAHALLAKIYAQLKLYNRAAEYFELYLDHFPKATQERFELGMAVLDGGAPKSALEIWAPLLADASHPPAMFYSALAHAELQDAAAARKQLDILLKSVAPDNLYFNRAKELLISIDSNASKRPVQQPIHEANLN